MLKELKKSMRRVKDVAHSRTQSQIPTPVPTQSPATGTTVQDATSPKIDNSATKAPPGLISPDPEHPSAIQDPNQPIPASSGPSSVGEQSAEHLSWAGLKSLISVLEAGSGAFGPLKSAIGGLSQCIEIFEHKNQIGEEYKKLRAELNAILKDLSNYLGGSSPPTMTPVIENIASSIEREVNTTIEKEGRHKLGRYAGAAEDEDEILECYRNIQTLLGRLTLNVNMSIWKSIDEQTTDLRLDRLPNAPMAMYRSAASESLRRTGCTPNTRVDVIKQLLNWAHDRNGEKVYWLNGMAGTGKTTIAYTFCDHLRRNHQLGASFFCSRQLPECRDVNRIVPSISYQLSLFSLPFRHALSEVLEKHRDIHNQLLQDQFEYLVAAPLLRVAHTFGADVTIVIDALDECDDRGGVERVLAVLLSCAPALSVNFLVTSRPEPEILDHMRSREDRGRPSELRLHDLDRSVVQQDITAYLEDMLPRDKVSNAQITELARRSGVLFIYASTVVRYIGHNKFVWSPSRLHAVLEASATTTIGSDRDIDKLYTTILNTALNDDSLERSEMEVRRDVLRHVVCAREPLSVVTIAELLGLGDTGLIQAALGPLLSVLNVSDTDGLVTMLHESFPNYILNRNRSGDFHCDARQHHARMAQLCFDAIKVPTPPFNICKLESSYVFDKDVPNIEERVGKVISKGLMYACQYWGAHLELAQAASYLTDALHELLSVRLLLWMEVLNLKNRMHEGVVMLHKIQIWCKAEVNFKGVYPLALDAYRFASVASSSYLLRSTPHIYISALSFWPQSRPVSRCYLPKTSGLVRVTGTALARQELAPVTIYAHSEVTCIAYSNDGVHIASSHYDGSIWIWDARTGQTVGEPLNGHILFAFSVVYSPDSAQIISGGHDRTIRIWDAQTHEIMGEPLRGHTGSVLWVTCSPDGIHLASGSEDKTIRIWNRHTGQLVGHPLEGHTDSVESVSYSPDGAYIASGSLDTTIRIWEVIAGTMVGDALKGHSDGVQSVAYSPNGAYVISGSVDASIYIWNARTGQTIGQLLEGHTSAINSVRYSPSGAHIISGSSDNTVCIWDAHSHRMIDRLNNHDDEVLSVSFSPDGAYIISCSPDRTIHVREANNHEVAVQAPPDHVYDAEVTTPIPPNPRPIFGSNDDVSGIWDETTSPAVWRLPEGHTDPVLSVACSPDGTYLASGSEDKTIRIWDARTGKMARQPLKGHTDWVESVTYLSDSLRVASSSADGTIRVWDVQSGQPIGPPLGDHASRLSSFACSPDGVYTVSGSYSDSTICIWDTHAGKIVEPPLRGHTSGIRSVSFSPDGTYVVSGSEDQTLRVWDVRARKQIGEPFRGHTGAVLSVSYCPVGAYIISGSGDRTVRIWDAHNGQIVGYPLEGHTDSVWSVSYSSDGAYIVSSSEDGVIRLWDAHTGQMAGSQFICSSDSIYSVAFSPDGTRVVSSCDDGIHIWHTQTHQMVSAWNDSGSRPRFIEPCACNVCNSSLGWDSWTLGEDGWIINERSEPLIWVPSNLLSSLLYPHNTILISRHGTLELDFGGAKLGTEWQRCYTP